MEQPKANDNLVVNIPKPIQWVIPDSVRTDHAQFGTQLATMLAKVLDELEKNNREAIGPIVSILEPYMEVNRDLKVNILPKSSREVNIEITKVGRVTSKIYLDESLT